MLDKSYLCDGKRPCCSSSYCYVNGGECMHTAHMENSISKKYPEFAPTYFMLDEDENVVECIDTASIMRTCISDSVEASEKEALIDALTAIASAISFCETDMWLAVKDRLDLVYNAIERLNGSRQARLSESSAERSN